MMKSSLRRGEPYSRGAGGPRLFRYVSASLASSALMAAATNSRIRPVIFPLVRRFANAIRALASPAGK